MSPAPLPVSLVVPTFNRGYCLGETLESLFSQSSPAGEIIVVDDGSEDDTARVVRENFPTACYHCKPNGGVASARNFGVAHAQFPWIAFCDSDDRWEPSKLQRQFPLHASGGWLWSQTGERWIRDGVRVNPMEKHAKEEGFIFDRLLDRCLVTPSAVILHRELLQRVGGFDETFRVCEDFELWLRVGFRFPIGLARGEWVEKRGGHPDQLSRSPIPFEGERVRALELFLTTHRHLLSPRVMELVVSAILRKLAILERGASKSQGSDAPDIKKKIEYYEKLNISSGVSANEI